MSANLPKLRSTNILNVLRGSPSELKELKKVDPRSRYVLLYPGSEFVYTGMGFNLLNTPPAEEVFQNANKILNRDLLKLCLSGSKTELLGSMENRQLATYVTSHAVMAKLAHDRPHVIPCCKAAGGIGVGFINSLVFSGALTFEDGLELVQKQAQAMDKASEVIPSARLSVRVMPATRTRKVCQAAVEYCIKNGIPREIAVCSVSRQTAAHVIEISGHEEAINFLEREGSQLFEYRWMKRLNHTKGGHHTELMMPVTQFLRFYLEQKRKENPQYLNEPTQCSVYSATRGARVRGLHNIVKDLYDYPIRPLQVEQLLHCLFRRPKELAQPNILVLWDKRLLKTLSSVNRRAYESAKLLEA